MAYDPKCYELAEAFLEDEPAFNLKANKEELAQEIQTTIENWLDDVRGKERDEPRETGDAWTGGFAKNH